MSLDTYDVYFSGATLKDADRAEAKRKVGAIFKLEGEKLERLFSGKPIPIKRGVDMDQAVKYRVAFRDAGALVDIVPAGQPAPDPATRPSPPQRPAAPANTAAATTPPPGPAETPAEPTGAGLSLAEGPMNPPPQPPAEPISVPDYGLSAANDFNLSDCAPPVEAAPVPDISALDLEKTGSILDESADPEPLEIDTEALELDAPGTPLIEPGETPEPAIDTTALSMSEPNEGSLEGYQKPVEPAPLPTTDHLHLEEAKERPKSEGKAKFVIADD
ncbi:MAG: hypothetical protein P8103_06480 [Candidatus Thiodiazotropha sp.]